MKALSDRDFQGRLDHSAAIENLIDEANYKPGANTWERADLAIQDADEETVRAALRGLLALKMIHLQDTLPQVAMRNLKVGDVVMMDGAKRVVKEVTFRGTEGQTVAIKATLHHCPNLKARPFFYDRDVSIPLFERTLED